MMKDVTTIYSESDVVRFWSKVTLGSDDECWAWNAGKQKGGYGAFKFSGRLMGAHRFSLMIASGMLDNSKYACHTCDNPECVNPKHLFWGTAQDNNMDTVQKGRWAGGNANKTHCIRGHEFNDENTYYRPQGGRQCRACRLTNNTRMC